MPSVGCSRSLWDMTTPSHPAFGGGSLGSATGATVVVEALGVGGVETDDKIIDVTSGGAGEPRGADADLFSHQGRQTTRTTATTKIAATTADAMYHRCRDTTATHSPSLPDIDSPREDGKQVVQEGLVDCSRRCRPPPVVRRPDDYFVTQQLGRIDNVILVHAFVSDNYVTGLPQSAGAGQHRLCGRHRAGGEPMVPTIKFQEAGNRR